MQLKRVLSRPSIGGVLILAAGVFLFGPALASLYADHCPGLPGGGPVGRRHSCPTRTQTWQPGENVDSHPGGAKGRRPGQVEGTASQGKSVHCQWINDKCVCGSIGKTGKNIPCRPESERQTDQSRTRPCAGPFIRTAQDLAKIAGNYETAPILVAALCSPPSPPNTWLVAMSGTQFRRGQPTGVEEIINTAFRLRDRYSTTVVGSLNRMGVPAGANVILAGHSLGGMVAQNLPVLPEQGYMQRWRTLRVITFGSPIMNQLRVDRDARRFAVRGDQVVLLVSYWVARFGYREMFYPPDITGLSKKPIWVDGGRVFDPSGIALHGAYGESIDLKNYDALGDQGSQILQIDASKTGQFGRGLGGADPEACPESRQWALSLLPRPPMRDKIGIPENAVRRSDVIYGLYNRSQGITLPDWAEETNTRTVQSYLTREDYRNAWQNRARYDIDYAYGFDKAARERVQAHFDLNELSVRKALGSGSGDTDRELRWLRRWWRDFENSPVKPRFWCGGRQTKPPWQWANPDRAEYL